MYILCFALEIFSLLLLEITSLKRKQEEKYFPQVIDIITISLCTNTKKNFKSYSLYFDYSYYIGFLLKLLNMSVLMLVTLTHLFMSEFEVHANKKEQSTL